MPVEDTIINKSWTSPSQVCSQEVQITVIAMKQT